jgi:predicted nucleic acid-binding Zn ribbon protein
MKKKCLICGSPLYGRIDKKFCSDTCRNKYHNSRNVHEDRYIRMINYILRKNRRILKDLENSGIESISRSDLAYAGFNFNFITTIQEWDKQNTCYFCYDRGYIIDQGERLILVKKEILEKTVPLFIGNGSL